MNPTLDLGITIILFLQNLGDWLVAPMQFFTFLGREEFFLLVMPALLWCIDARLGLRIGAILLISNGLNSILKIVFSSPRPYFYSDQVRALSTETSFGVPSAHAQNAAAVWGLLAVQFKNWWGWAIMIALIFMIGLSRMYLGVHFPSDVLWGWIIGGLVLWGFLKMEAPLSERLKRQAPARQALSVLGISLVIILLGVIARASLGDWTIPPAWLENAALAAPGAETPDPLSLSAVVLVAGAFFGLFGGAILMATWGGFSAQGLWWQRALRYPLGLAGVIILWFGLGAIFPRGDYVLAYSLRYLRYALIGLWISAIAPLIFIRMGLASFQNAPLSGERPTSVRGIYPNR